MTQDRRITVFNGWPMLGLNLTLLLGSASVFIWEIVKADQAHVDPSALILISAALTFFLSWVLFSGHFTLQPNEARVLVLFGRYVGTVHGAGFHWTNPFATKIMVSLRRRNLDGATLKVNDRRGNPIEISAVVVWHVDNAAQALFDVDDFADYVRVQSESALRNLATRYAYDQGEDESELTLRASTEEISSELKGELCERLAGAGVVIDEARLNHLAYAPEIAGAMLRRQQAEAVIDARQKIVQGAVSMVDMAIQGLAEKSLLELDEERKAAMVSNLLVVLCGESDAQPVINTGTLYS
jgi:regulator of protease activity HflC (stomatin/prohibitin superfamily)